MNQRNSLHKEPGETESMRAFMVTLERPRTSYESLESGIAHSRGIVDRFDQALHSLVAAEGLTQHLGAVQRTANLPVVFVTATHRLAERIREMRGVSNVSHDREIDLQT